MRPLTQHTIDTFNETIDRFSGWKLEELYNIINDIQTGSRSALTVSIEEGAGFRTTVSFDWAGDLRKEENVGEKFQEARRTIKRCILAKMLVDKDVNTFDWESILG